MADPVFRYGGILLDCLNEQFLTPQFEALAAPGEFCMIAGEQMSEDIDPLNGEDTCCTGRGWVRIGETFPSSNFPTQDSPGLKCPTGWAQRYEVGLLGCYHPGGDPAAATCVQHTQQSLIDSERLWALKLTACCFGAALEANPKSRGKLWGVESIVVSGPRGNCISRVMSVLVSIGKCC